MNYLTKSLFSLFVLILIGGVASAQTFQQGRVVGVQDAQYIYNSYVSIGPCGGLFGDQGGAVNPFEDDFVNQPIIGDSQNCYFINTQFWSDYSWYRNLATQRISQYQGTAWEQYWRGYLEGLTQTVNGFGI